MTTKPTVVILAPDMRSGGSVGAVAWRHALELSSRCRVYVITREVPAGGHAGIGEVIVRTRNWTWLRRFCHVPNELAFIRAAKAALQALCRREEIDVVWCHSHSTTALAAAPLSQRFGFRVVMTTHGDIFDRPSGTYSRELTWFYQFVTPRAYRLADTIQALSPYMAERAIDRGARPDRVRVVPNGIDPEEIGAGTLGQRVEASFMPDGVLRILYVGSLWSLKGIDVLLRALALLVTEPAHPSAVGGGGPHRRFVLTLIGEGGERARLEKLIGELGTADCVRFLGRMPRRELAAQYLQADLLCVPSLSEALSNVTLEGMLCGLPVVGSNTGGIPFLVEDGISGYLAVPGDPTALAAAIAKAASSRTNLAELGGEGFRKARRQFGWPEIADQLEELVGGSAASSTEQPRDQ